MYVYNQQPWKSTGGLRVKQSFMQFVECFNELLGILIWQKSGNYAKQLKNDVLALDEYFYIVELNLLSRTPLLIITSLYIIKI